MGEENPFAPGWADQPVSSAPPFANFGRYFGTAFQVYGRRWREWIVPMLVAGCVFVPAVACFYIPFFLVAGPLSCGLYACALATLRGRPIGAKMLWPGWPAAWSSLGAWLAATLLAMLPGLVVQVVWFATIFLVLPPGVGPGQANQPVEPWMIVVMLGVFPLLAVGSLFSMAWSLWVNTRTLFIIPLIAERGLDFHTAWSASWQATRSGFWELLLLQFVAAFIGVIGAYACLIGAIFTVPIYFTIVATAYEDRFASEGQVS
jgi:hypothetical protein